MKKYKPTIYKTIYICPETNTMIIKKIFSKKEYHLTQIIRKQKINYSWGTSIDIFFPNSIKQVVVFGPTLTDDKLAEEFFLLLTGYERVFHISDSGKELVIFNKSQNTSPDFEPIITLNVDNIVDYRPLHITDLSGTYVNSKFIIKLEIVLVTKDSKEYIIPYVFKRVRVSDPIAIEAYQTYQKDLKFFSQLIARNK